LGSHYLKRNRNLIIFASAAIKNFYLICSSFSSLFSVLWSQDWAICFSATFCAWSFAFRPRPPLIPGMPRAQRVVCLFEVSAGSWVFGSVELSWELSCAGSYRGVPGSFGGVTGPGAADGANERAILNRLYCLQSESVL